MPIDACCLALYWLFDVTTHRHLAHANLSERGLGLQEEQDVARVYPKAVQTRSAAKK